MLWLKSCTRCQTGDLYMDEDDSKHCMQCGHIEYPTGKSSGVIDLEQALQAVLRTQTTSARGSGLLAMSASSR